jgi:hypothetical protein
MERLCLLFSIFVYGTLQQTAADPVPDFPSLAYTMYAEDSMTLSIPSQWIPGNRVTLSATPANTRDKDGLSASTKEIFMNSRLVFNKTFTGAVLNTLFSENSMIVLSKDSFLTALTCDPIASSYKCSQRDSKAIKDVDIASVNLLPSLHEIGGISIFAAQVGSNAILYAFDGYTLFEKNTLAEKIVQIEAQLYDNIIYIAMLSVEKNKIFVYSLDPSSPSSQTTSYPSIESTTLDGFDFKAVQIYFTEHATYKTALNILANSADGSSSKILRVGVPTSSDKYSTINSLDSPQDSTFIDICPKDGEIAILKKLKDGSLKLVVIPAETSYSEVSLDYSEFNFGSPLRLYCAPQASIFSALYSSQSKYYLTIFKAGRAVALSPQSTPSPSKRVIFTSPELPATSFMVDNSPRISIGSLNGHIVHTLTSLGTNLIEYLFALPTSHKLTVSALKIPTDGQGAYNLAVTVTSAQAKEFKSAIAVNTVEYKKELKWSVAKKVQKLNKGVYRVEDYVKLDGPIITSYLIKGDSESFTTKEAKFTERVSTYRIYQTSPGEGHLCTQIQAYERSTICTGQSFFNNKVGNQVFFVIFDNSDNKAAPWRLTPQWTGVSQFSYARKNIFNSTTVEMEFVYLIAYTNSTSQSIHLMMFSSTTSSGLKENLGHVKFPVVDGTVTKLKVGTLSPDNTFSVYYTTNSGKNELFGIKVSYALSTKRVVADALGKISNVKEFAVAPLMSSTYGSHNLYTVTADPVPSCLNVTIDRLTGELGQGYSISGLKTGEVVERVSTARISEESYSVVLDLRSNLIVELVLDKSTGATYGRREEYLKLPWYTWRNVMANNEVIVHVVADNLNREVLAIYKRRTAADISSNPSKQVQVYYTITPDLWLPTALLQNDGTTPTKVLPSILVSTMMINQPMYFYQLSDFTIEIMADGIAPESVNFFTQYHKGQTSLSLIVGMDKIIDGNVKPEPTPVDPDEDGKKNNGGSGKGGWIVGGIVLFVVVVIGVVVFYKYSTKSSHEDNHLAGMEKDGSYMDISSTHRDNEASGKKAGQRDYDPRLG